MAKAFYTTSEPPQTLNEHRSRSPILSDSEAETDIEVSVSRVRSSHKNNEDGSSRPSSEDKNTENPPAKRIRRPGNALVRNRQISRDLRDATGQKILQKACARGDVELVRNLLKESPDLEDRDYAGTTALHSAALTGNEDIVKLLLDAGAVPDVRSGPEELDTPLMDASANCYFGVVQLLLDAGADPRIDNAIGRRAIDFAVEDSGFNISSSKKRKTSNGRSEFDQRNSILRALSFRTKALRRTGVPPITSPKDPNAHPSLFPPGFTGVQRSPPPIFLDVLKRSIRAEIIDHAAMGDLPYVGLALERGWQPTAQALVDSAKYGHSEVVGLLLAFSLDPNAEFDGTTALQQSILRDHFACAKLLVDSGAVIPRSYAQYVSDLPENNELRQLITGDLNVSTGVVRSIDDGEAPVAPSKISLRSIKPKRRQKEQAKLVSKEPAEEPAQEPVEEPVKEPVKEPIEETVDVAVKQPVETVGENIPVDPLKSDTPDPKNTTELADTSRIDMHGDTTELDPNLISNDSLFVDSETRSSSHIIIDDSIEIISNSPVPSSAELNSNEPTSAEQKAVTSDPGTTERWVSRSQELNELLERKEKERRDRETRMFQNLKKNLENDVNRPSSVSPLPTASEPHSLSTDQIFVPSPDTPVFVDTIVDTSSSREQTPSGEVELSVGDLPWIARQLAYTGEPQYVGPLYCYDVGEIPHCIDLQAALALGEPHLQDHLSPEVVNHSITAHQKQLLWSFCQQWVCYIGSGSEEIAKEKAKFMELALSWIPVSGIEEISKKLNRPLPSLVHIQLEIVPITPNLQGLVAPNCMDRNLPLVWQYKLSSS